MTVLPDDTTDTEHYPLYTLQSSSSTPPITVPACDTRRVTSRNGVRSGGSLFFDSWIQISTAFPFEKPTKIRLCVYNGEPTEILGSVDITVAYKTQSACVPLLVVKHCGPNLPGHNWLQKFSLGWREIHFIHLSPIEALLGCIPRDSGYPTKFQSPHLYWPSCKAQIL